MKGRQKPDWLKVRLPTSKVYGEVRKLITDYELHTVCESAACPNRGECWSRSTATFMILGNICTRSCGFCNVITGKPTELDLDEPRRVAEAVEILKLKYAVITSVNRDELKDGGASVWAETIRCVRERNPETKIEVLIPDFCSNWDALQVVIDARPDVLNHNTETVPRLYLPVRPQGNFKRSLELLKISKEKGMVTKSGIMLGLGETREQVEQAMRDLRAHDVDMLTIGQYLQPTAHHHPVKRYWTPDEFDQLGEFGQQIGFSHVASAPLVRSSYHADRMAAAVGQADDFNPLEGEGN